MHKLQWNNLTSLAFTSIPQNTEQFFHSLVSKALVYCKWCVPMQSMHCANGNRVPTLNVSTRHKSFDFPDRFILLPLGLHMFQSWQVMRWDELEWMERWNEQVMLINLPFSPRCIIFSHLASCCGDNRCCKFASRCTLISALWDSHSGFTVNCF